MSDKLITPSVFAFERKLDPSDALFYAGKWDDRRNSQNWKAISLREKAVRGTISNRLKTGGSDDSAKLDAKVEDANLQRVDVAALPNDCDTLKVCFTLRILGDVGKPWVCNNVEYAAKLEQIVKTYKEKNGLNELAKRYAHNLANARFLWRNRMSSETVEVYIYQQRDGKRSELGQFNSLDDFSLREFLVKDNSSITENFNKVCNVIREGLEGKNYVLLVVEAFARMGEGQEVFPSQELVLDQKSSKKGDKSKVLYSINEIAAMHSQKIGNAIRTIDDWYPNKDDFGPIAAEPYGSVTTLGKAFRQPKEKLDFYSLLEKWVLKDKELDEGDQHYVIANLIRGGVFGESSKE